jgi:hypothetical protein
LKVAEQLFAFFVMLEFDDDKELMMMMIASLFKYFSIVVFFIYNCYVCFNGNKLTRFFDSPPPKLSDYLAR